MRLWSQHLAASFHPLVIMIFVLRVKDVLIGFIPANSLIINIQSAPWSLLTDVIRGRYFTQVLKLVLYDLVCVIVKVSLVVSALAGLLNDLSTPLLATWEARK